MAWARHGHGMASVNQTRPHCVNQMGKKHSKSLVVRHGRGTAWVRHGHGMLCVNRPLLILDADKLSDIYYSLTEDVEFLLTRECERAWMAERKEKHQVRILRPKLLMSINPLARIHCVMHIRYNIPKQRSTLT